MGRLLVLVGCILIAVGLFWGFRGRGLMDRMPGDLVFRIGDVRVHFLLVLSLVLSVFVSLLLWLFRR